MEFIEFSQVENHIARLVVNRPEVRNALHWEAMDEFSQVVESLKEKPDVRALLVSGAGRAFISGADLGLVSSLQTREEGERLSKQMGETLAQLRALPVVSIAVIGGPARGGGAEIAVSCDLRLMSTTATIAFVQTSLGLIPGWGGANRLFGLVGYAKALEFLASARVIDAAEAEASGLVNNVFPDDQLNEEALKLARKITANNWEAVRTIKEMLNLWGEDEVSQQRRLAEREYFVKLWDREERQEIFAKMQRNREQANGRKD